MPCCVEKYSVCNHVEIFLESTQGAHSVLRCICSVSDSISFVRDLHLVGLGENRHMVRTEDRPEMD